MAVVVAAAAAVANVTTFLVVERYTSERQAYLIERIFERHWNKLVAADTTARVSVMLKSVTWRKLLPLPGLKTAHGISRRVDSATRALRLSRTEGVEGWAFRSGDWALGVRTTYVVDGHEEQASIVLVSRGFARTLNGATMSRALQKQMEDVDFMCSYPIRRLERRKDGATSSRVSPLGKVVGVINFYSSDLSKYFIRNNGGFSRTKTTDELISSVLKNLATAAGYIYG